MPVNENLYNWLNKTQGLPAAEWYRNNPTKPHTSNPHVPPGAAKWFPTASADDPYRQTLASTSDPFKTQTVTKTASTSNAQPFEDYLNSLYEKASSQYEEQKKNYPSLPSEVASASRGSDVYYYPEYGEYGGYVSKTNPDKEQVARIQKWISEGATSNPDSPLYGQNLSNLLRTEGQGGWHIGAASATDPEPLQYGLENVGLERYRSPRKTETIAKLAEGIYSKESGGKSFADFLEQGLSGKESEPVRENNGPQETDYSIATVQGASDEQRQEQIAQSQFDPQKAKTATTAAKAYKQAVANEDPFRSQAVFGQYLTTVCNQYCACISTSCVST